MQIIGLTGQPFNGKDTAAHYLKDGSRLHARSGKMERTEELFDELLAAGDKILVSYSRLVREFPGVLHIDPSTGIPGLPPIRELDV